MNPILPKTPAQERAEQLVKQALLLIAKARMELTIWEFERYVAANQNELGGNGYLASIGQAIVSATAKPTTS